MKLARVALAAVLVMSCNRVDLKYAPVDDAGDPGCSDVPRMTCEASLGPSKDTCTGGQGLAGSNEWLLPTDASFGGGCQAYFRGKDCSDHGYCTCDVDDGGGQALWNCHDVDGGD